jgi:capsular polysaccharide transport system ATP-binding protein
MIELHDVCKKYTTRTGERLVLDRVNLKIRPGEKLGILGKNGAGKSTLIRLLSGAEHVSSGTIRRDMSISWPLAFTGGFQGSLSGLDNLKFICRVYGVDFRSRIEFVQEFSELGVYLREPVRTYSSGMRARLAFAISMAVDFSCFLIDEVIAVGDSRFHEKCRAELFERRKDRAMVIVSHMPDQIQAHCDRAGVLHDGQLRVFDTVNEAYGFYQDCA